MNKSPQEEIACIRMGIAGEELNSYSLVVPHACSFSIQRLLGDAHVPLAIPLDPPRSGGLPPQKSCAIIASAVPLDEDPNWL